MTEIVPWARAVAQNAVRQNMAANLLVFVIPRPLLAALAKSRKIYFLDLCVLASYALCVKVRFLAFSCAWARRPYP